MPVHTEYRDDLENRYNESKKELESAQWEKERTGNAYEGAQNTYETYENEAAHEWGDDVPPGNTSEKRDELKADRDKKYEEYMEASSKEETAKAQYEYDKQNWDTYQGYEKQMYSEEEDYDKSL